MYDELVEALRLCVKYARPFDALANAEQAADAIEELSASVEGFEAQTNIVLDRDGNNTVIRFEPLWIPVTERLPEKTNHYLVHVKCECDGELVSAWEQVAWFCEKFYWEHLHGDDVFKETVTHWMELPPPPKEEV